MSLSGDHHLSEDITQDTFLAAITHAESYDGSVKMITWLCTIAKNKYISYLRKQKKIAGEVPENISAPENDMLADIAQTDIYKAVHALPEPYKEIILLRIHTDMSFAQIGEIFGKGESWARVTFFRGKSRLKAIIDEKEC